MPTTLPEVHIALTNFLLDNWVTTPMCEKGTGGLDMTNQVAGSLFDSDVDFIEIEFTSDSRQAAGVSRESGTYCIAYLDVQMYIRTGIGTIEIARLEHTLCSLLNRKTISTAQIRSALPNGRPYEFRGRVTKKVSFPVEFYETS